MKLFLSGLFALILLSPIAKADPSMTCEFRSGFDGAYISAINIDVILAFQGGKVPGRFLKCNYKLRDGGIVLKESTLYCRDSNNQPTGPIPIEVFHEDSNGRIHHRIRPLEGHANALGFEEFEAAYDYDGSSGQINAVFAGQHLGGKARCF
ncbi:MAG: hypothetical protein KDD43_14300 [Bdellovibrionales bacterium]|nr:hypothetical protein [Bdellovibrionales bacterium]